MKSPHWPQLGFAVSYIWIGFVCAISFMEAPLKFRAPSLTREVALEVGHIVFHALNRVETVLALVLLAMLFKGRYSIRTVRLFGAVSVILLVQTLVLYPQLDARTLARIAGETLAESHLHLVFVVLEVLKVGFLLFLAGAQLGDFRRRERRAKREKG